SSAEFGVFDVLDRPGLHSQLFGLLRAFKAEAALLSRRERHRGDQKTYVTRDNSGDTGADLVVSHKAGAHTLRMAEDRRNSLPQASHLDATLPDASERV